MRSAARALRHGVSPVCSHALLRTPKQPAQPRYTAASSFAPNVARAYDNATAPPEPQANGQEAPALGVETWLGTGYEVYKRGGALQLKPIVPKFQQSATGTYVMQRKGVLLLEMAAATGTRQYDWANKISFALSVTEMADLFFIPNALEGKGVSMMHDPGMQSGTQGEVTKSLQASMMPDGRNINVSLSERNASSGQRNISVQLTPGELAVATEIARYMIPRCCGLDKNW